MNIPRTQVLARFAALLLLASLTRADDAVYAEILKKRDAVLSQILAEREARSAIGTGDEEAVISARLALCSFRRDTAPSKEMKIKQQELIVAIWQKKLGALKDRAVSGAVGHEELLLATDSLLQAQQLLEVLKLEGKKG